MNAPRLLVFISVLSAACFVLVGVGCSGPNPNTCNTAGDSCNGGGDCCSGTCGPGNENGPTCACSNSGGSCLTDDDCCGNPSFGGTSTCSTDTSSGDGLGSCS